MSGFTRRGFLVMAGVSVPAVFSFAQSAGDDPLLKALLDELERSRQLRVINGGGDEIPYFIAYTLGDQQTFSVAATLGAVTVSGANHQRVPIIEVRVGSYDFDNTGHIFSGAYSGSRYDTEPWPLDNNYQNMRESLWLATDHAYKAAVESIARKRAALNSVVAPGEKQADYSKSEPIVSLAKLDTPKIDEKSLSARAAKLSGIFASYPEIVASGIEISVNVGPTYYVNTEGTQLRFPDDVVWLTARAESQAADGMLIREGLSVASLDLEHFPGEAELDQGIRAMADRVKARWNAPVAGAPGDSFTGPVLFEPYAAAQLMAQLIGDNVRVPRRPVSEPGRQVNFTPSEFEGRIGNRVLPDWMDVIDDPTQTTRQGKPLLGFYPYDIEGVKPKTVTLVEKGALKSFLWTRLPGKSWTASNGRARLAASYGWRSAAISNLFVNASQTEPLTGLKAKLVQMCKDRDKPYGFLVRRLDYPFASGGGELQSLLAGARTGGSARAISPPTLIYRVYPDGREELVRGLRFRGVSIRTLRDILAASSETAQFDFVNNGAPLALLGGGGLLAPASVIAPGILFDEMEFERPQDQLQRPPIVPPPNAKG
ncbi:MAG: metallopeptidase TldD-related protein [Bryobacteraceae bacterium]